MRRLLARLLAFTFFEAFWLTLAVAFLVHVLLVASGTFS